MKCWNCSWGIFLYHRQYVIQWFHKQRHCYKHFYSHGQLINSNPQIAPHRDFFVHFVAMFWISTRYVLMKIFHSISFATRLHRLTGFPKSRKCQHERIRSSSKKSNSSSKSYMNLNNKLLKNCFIQIESF